MRLQLDYDTRQYLKKAVSDELKRRAIATASIDRATLTRTCKACGAFYILPDPDCEECMTRLRKQQAQEDYRKRERQKRRVLLDTGRCECGDQKPCPFMAKHEVNGKKVCGTHRYWLERRGDGGSKDTASGGDAVPESRSAA